MRKLTTEEFILKAELKHNSTYGYGKSKYVNSRTKVMITCHVHGDFEQTANNHLSGAGCPSCSKTGFSPNKSAILYYLEILTNKEEYLYKIGITNKSINRRYSSKERSIIKVLKERYYPNGMDALKAEQENITQTCRVQI